MTLRLNGSTSGYVEVDAPAVSDNSLVTLPTGGGTLGRMQLMTAQSATGTAVDFTDIPSWVKRITVMFSGVSTSGTSSHSFLLGTSSGLATSGYTGVSGYSGGTPVSTNLSTSFVNYSDLASDLKSGMIVFSLMGSNTWSCAGQFAYHARAFTQFTTGSVTLSGTLDRIRITTVNGADIFDAGTINLLLEG